MTFLAFSERFYNQYSVDYRDMCMFGYIVHMIILNLFAFYENDLTLIFVDF